MFDTDRSGTIGFNEFWLVAHFLDEAAVEFLISNFRGSLVDCGGSWRPGGPFLTASTSTGAETLATLNLPTLWPVCKPVRLY